MNISKIHKNIKIAVVFLGVFLSACQSTTEKYVKSHPELPKHIMQAIRQERITNGMTVDAVKAVLGEPAFVDRGPSEETSPREIWIYQFEIEDEPESNDTEFSQGGILSIIPSSYPSRQIEVTFHDQKVCKIRHVLSW